MLPLYVILLLSLSVLFPGGIPAADSVRPLADDTAVAAADSFSPAARHPLAAFGLTLFAGLRDGVRWLRDVLKPVTDALTRVAQRLFKNTPAKDQILRLPLSRRNA